MKDQNDFESKLSNLHALLGEQLRKEADSNNRRLSNTTVDLKKGLNCSIRELFFNCRLLINIIISLLSQHPKYVNDLDINVDNEGGDSSKARKLVEYLISSLQSSKITDKEYEIIGSQAYKLTTLLIAFLDKSSGKLNLSQLRTIGNIAQNLQLSSFFLEFSISNGDENDELIRYSQSAYNQLESNLETARQLESEFQSILNKVRAQFDIVVEQRRKAEESKEEVIQTVANANNFYSTIKKGAEETSSRLQILNDRQTKMFEQFESLKQTISESESSIVNLIKSAESTNDRLQQLLDPAVALDLLSTFKRRKRWLFIATIVWAVFGLASAITLGWQTSVLLTAPGDLSLERTLSISLRILPFVVLLFFCLRQFTKNRNLEEEYAFRESIATSMMSYVEKIEGDTKIKEELIRDTVTKLYTSPLARIAEASQSSTESKQSESLIQSIADLLKQTTSAVKKGQ